MGIMRGFTFLEVVIVVSILGILAMLGMSALTAAVDDTRLSGAADEIATALEFAKLTAVGTGRQTRVVFDKNAESIEVEQFETGIDLMGSETELAEAVIEGGAFSPMDHPLKRGDNYLIDFSSENRFKGVDLIEALFNSTNIAAFDSRGHPSAGGSVTVGVGDRQVVLTVDSQSGKVTRSD